MSCPQEPLARSLSLPLTTKSCFNVSGFAIFRLSHIWLMHNKSGVLQDMHNTSGTLVSETILERKSASLHTHTDTHIHTITQTESTGNGDRAGKKGRHRGKNCKKDDNTNGRHLPCTQPLGQQFFRRTTTGTTLTVCRTSPSWDRKDTGSWKVHWKIFCLSTFLIFYNYGI